MQNKNVLIDIKGAVLDRQDLCSYLEKLASDHTTTNYSNKNAYPIPNLKDDFEYILKTYNLLNEHVKLKINIHAAGEWILDNFYIIEETYKTIEKELTIKKYVNLAGLASGQYKGYSRSLILASEIVQYTDGKIDQDNLKLFLKAYQTKKTLTMEEIWIFPLFLQINIIHYIKQICEKVYASQMQKYKVESMTERLVEKKDKQTFKNYTKSSFSSNQSYELPYPFVEYMSYKLKQYGKKGYPYLQALEEQVRKIGSSISEIIKKEHFDIAVKKVSIGNSIKSIKDITRMDFLDVFEQINGIEEILKKDPAGVFEKMDYETKDYYRQTIKQIADKVGISEMYVAETVLKLAQNASNIDNNKDDISNNQILRNNKKSHIGYYLIENKSDLYKKIGLKNTELTKKQKSRLYIVAIACLPAFLSLIFYMLYYLKSKNIIISSLLAVTSYIPFTEICIQTVNYILSKVVRPKFIPKLDLSNGVEKDAATFVVIPTIVGEEKKIEELVRKLEVYYLANKSENVYFALLADCTSSKNQEEKIDEKIAKKGLEKIKELNEKYKTQGFPIFHYIYRKRSWNNSEKTYLGWERKRGLLSEFNKYLLKNEKGTFAVNSLDNVGMESISTRMWAIFPTNT